MSPSADRDDFLEKQLKPETLEQAARKGGHALTLRLQPGYDHSYFLQSIGLLIGENADTER